MEIRQGAFDLHGHTRYSGTREGVLYSPTEAVLHAKSVGLDGLAITGHNTIEGLQEGLDAAKKEGIILVPGIEISDISYSGMIPTSHHILALGISPDTIVGRDRIPVLRPPMEIIKWIHAHDGVAIGVHAKPKASFMSMSYEQLEDVVGKLDGMEILNGADLRRGFGGNYPMRGMARAHGLAEIGGSDFHRLNDVGIVATHVFGNCENWQDVVEAIRKKQVEPFVRMVIPHEVRERNKLKNLLNELII